MKPILTRDALISAAKDFCLQKHIYRNLFGVTDGKAVGTFIEHKFQAFLDSNYRVDIGSSAEGLDLPKLQIDIKATSIRQPQSSCPYRSASQKVYGLGYNLLLFVYEKTDDRKIKAARLSFASCAFVEKSRTSDYQTTR